MLGRRSVPVFALLFESERDDRRESSVRPEGRLPR
jgi:hypothetical protein